MLDLIARKRGALALGAMALMLALAGSPVGADNNPGPVGGQDWYPSKWGAGDERGASNYMRPAKVREAVALIETGKVYSLGRLYDADMPFYPGRNFTLRIPGAPTAGPLGENKVLANEEFLATEIGQVGTQFDGLAHIGVQLGGANDDGEKRFYNGMSLTEIHGSYGFKKLGVENVEPFLTPAVMFDVKALIGRSFDRGEVITVEHLKDALARQGLSENALDPGDVALIRTGWGDHWMKDNESYYDGEPGIDVAAAQWLIDQGVSMIGADNWAVEVLPNPDPELAYPVHQLALTKHGVYLFENLDLDALSEDEVYRGAFFFSPVPIKGATGSPGNPIVVR